MIEKSSPSSTFLGVKPTCMKIKHQNFAQSQSCGCGMFLRTFCSKSGVDVGTFECYTK